MGQSVSVALCPGNRPRRTGTDDAAEEDGDVESQLGVGPGSAKEGGEAMPAPSSSSASAPQCHCAESTSGEGHHDIEIAAHVGSDVNAPFKPIFCSLAVGPLKCNMSIVGDPETKEAVLVDPGGDHELILEKIKELDVKITKILITHGHFDHFLAAGHVRKATGAPVYLHKEDRVLWGFLPMQLRVLGMVLHRDAVTEIGRPDEFLTDGMKVGILDGVCIHTPGHTEGSCCFYWKESRLLVAGDTLFRGSVGRTDTLGGNPEKLKASVLNKLYVLPDEVNVITGHGPQTMIGHEKRNNSFIRASL